MRRGALVLVAVAAVSLPAFSQQPGDQCDACGTVVSIQTMNERAQWTPLGTVTPSTVDPAGSMTGSATKQLQIGRDLKNQGIVVLGAAGGAAYAKRPNEYTKPRWDVTVKMERGGTRVVSQGYEPFVREGDRVRVLGTQLELVNP